MTRELYTRWADDVLEARTGAGVGMGNPNMVVGTIMRLKIKGVSLPPRSVRGHRTTACSSEERASGCQVW